MPPDIALDPAARDIPIVSKQGGVSFKFFTGYVIEKSLSVDNIFVIVMIFAYFGVPREYQHRVLFWGIVGALVTVRFALGMGEAVALPSFNRAVANWVPADSRGFGIGIAIGGIGLGSAVTPPVAAWVMVNWGWQTVFYLSAGLGICMGILWWLLARDRPSDHPWALDRHGVSVTSAGQDGKHPVSWRWLLRSPAIWWS